MSAFTESVVEEAALAWLEAIGWRIAHGPDIAPDMPAAERRDYGEVVLAQRLRDALARLNPALPAEALDDAFRKLTRSEGADLIQRNRALHRLLVNGSLGLSALSAVSVSAISSSVCPSRWMRDKNPANWNQTWT